MPLHELRHVFLNNLQYVAEDYGVQKVEWTEAKAWFGIARDRSCYPSRNFRQFSRDTT